MTDTLPRQIWPSFLRAEILALLVAIFAQTAGAVYWGGQLASRVSALEAKVTATSHQGEDIARIDERTKSMDEALQRMERQLEARSAK